MRILDTIEQLRQGMDYHLARHNLLTANLAHVDTPGYTPLDLQRGGFEGVMRATLQATDPRHVGAAQHPEWRVAADANASPGEDGNGVNIDREAVKIATNNLRYDALGTLVAQELDQLRWAANDGKNT